LLAHSTSFFLNFDLQPAIDRILSDV
jgi:hypothetical protein